SISCRPREGASEEIPVRSEGGQSGGQPAAAPSIGRLPIAWNGNSITLRRPPFSHAWQRVECGWLRLQGNRKCSFQGGAECRTCKLPGSRDVPRNKSERLPRASPLC